MSTLLNQEKEIAVRELLTSLRFSPPGGKWQFVWNPQNPHMLADGAVYQFYVDFDKQTIGSIYALKAYPQKLNGYSIKEVSSLLHKYFQSVIPIIGINFGSFVREQGKTVLDITEETILPELIHNLDKFIDNETQPSLYLMPVTGFPCPKPVISNAIWWVSGNYDLISIFEPLGISTSSIVTAQFPPFNMNVNSHPLTDNDSWFICSAASDAEAESMFKRMTGALFMAMDYPKSRFITGRKMLDGRACIGHGNLSLADRRALVPPVGLPIVITEEMTNFIFSLIVRKFSSIRMQVALEYLADAWNNSPRLSFINASIAMDALFGINGKVKASILTGVEKYGLAIPNASDKYELILGMRNGLLHGEYSSIEQSPEYLQFYESYKTSPTDQQVLIIKACLFELSQSSDSLGGPNA